jgi:hypothetical protein
LPGLTRQSMMKRDNRKAFVVARPHGCAGQARA